MVKVPHLEALLGVSHVIERPPLRRAGDADFVVGWGTKPTARHARAYAKTTGLPYVAIEDGFLRSAGSASAKLPPVSVVLDDLGIYYEAGRRSRVETLIRSAPHFGKDIKQIAADGFELFLRHRLTKYNTVSSDPEPRRPHYRVMLVDQVFGDQSIAGGLASAASFRRMIDTALETFPAASIAVKVHPDVLAGRARGYIDRVALDHGLAVIADMGNPHDLLDHVDALWTVTSQLGLEAAFKGLPVRCFGVPFYAGWGLTEDTPDNPTARTALVRRGAERDALDLFAAAYVAYPNYADPVGGRPISLPEAIDRLVLWRDRAECNRGDVVCAGWPLTRRAAARAYFHDGGGTLTFSSGRAAVRAAKVGNGRLLSWQAPKPVAAACAAGLDAAVVRETPLRVLDPCPPGAVPAALEVDGRAARDGGASHAGLIWSLHHYPFTEAERDRAAAVIEDLLPAPPARTEPATPTDRKTIVVLGERFQSWRADETSGFRNNRQFLRMVRAEHRDALLLYVEHPDVARRMAPGWLTPGQIAANADQVLSLQEMLSGTVDIDEVHTIASDTGFWALMAGLDVTCWGRPFYAGWGVTRDRQAFPDRVRRLSPADLAAAVLILGARYVDRRTEIPCEVEDVAARIVAGRAGRIAARMMPRAPWYSPALSALRRASARVRHFLFFA